MQHVLDVERWIYVILYWGILLLEIWAAIDCVSRKAAAFPAAGKLTKPAWMLLTILSAVLGFFAGPGLTLFSLAFLIVALVYLTDVRPAVREVSGGSRW